MESAHVKDVEKNLDQLKAKVIEEKALLGISYDGDGDRLGVVNILFEYDGNISFPYYKP